MCVRQVLHHLQCYIFSTIFGLLFFFFERERVCWRGVSCPGTWSIDLLELGAILTILILLQTDSSNHHAQS